MSPSNGTARRESCKTCRHWANERPSLAPDGKPAIGTPHQGDCTHTIEAVIAGLNPQGQTIQVPGGTFLVTFETSYCTGRYQPRVELSAIKNWGKPKPVEEKEPAA